MTQCRNFITTNLSTNMAGVGDSRGCVNSLVFSSCKLKADGSSESGHAANDNTNSSCSWDTEDVSISRLHLGPQSDELKDLVEDKEIAACAVAFVVSSMRKGIVPLCADVASLMRSKRRLEKRVAHLKHEVEELRNSSQHSFSSTPTSAQSYTSDRGSFMDPAHLQVFNELLKGTQKHPGMLSHSSSSSQVDGSPKLQRRQGSGLHRTVAAIGQTEPAVVQQRFDLHPFSSTAEMGKLSPEQTGNVSLKCGSPKDLDFPCDFVRASLSHTDVRATAPDGVGGCDRSSSHSVVSGAENNPVSRRVPSSCCKLPSRKSLPGRRPQSASDVDRYRTVADYCCSVSSSESMLTLEERFNKTLEMNLKLAEKLATTCRQMEVLATKLREFEIRELMRQGGGNAVSVAKCDYDNWTLGSSPNHQKHSANESVFDEQQR